MTLPPLIGTPESSGSATWDITVADTLGSAYLQQSIITGPTAAFRKTNKYSSLYWTHDFFQWLWKLLAL